MHNAKIGPVYLVLSIGGEIYVRKSIFVLAIVSFLHK